MDFEKELTLTKIIAGRLRLSVGSRFFWLCPPTIQDQLVAQELFGETLREARFAGTPTLSEIYSFLIGNGMWSEFEDQKIKRCQDQLENLKVELYEARLDSHRQQRVREAIQAVKTETLSLIDKKSRWNYTSAESVAQLAKYHYLYLCNITDENERRIPEQEMVPYFDDVCECYRKFAQEATDQIVRELSRSETWSNCWRISKDPQAIFGCPVTNLTHQQKVLCAFSRMYDNIYDHPDCPQEEIIQDDDMLDGWTIIQHRKREGNKDRKDIEAKISKHPKIASAKEVYVVVGDEKAAEKVYRANDAAGRAAVRRQFQRKETGS